MVASSRIRGLLISVSCLVFSVGAFAGHRHGTDISTDSDGAIQSCDDWHMWIDGERAVVSSETISVPGTSLAIDAARNGGVSIRGGSGSGFTVTLCRGARASLGNGVLSQITLRRSGDTLTVDGPSGDDWDTHFIVTAPAGASVRASASNGPVDASDFSGALDLDAKNGPISLDKVSGTISATTKNGPISLDEGSGQVSLKAINGPMTVELPRGFSSGVEIRSAGHTPWRCPEALCGAMAKSWEDDDDEEKVVRIGGATPIVHLATENGPVSVKER